MKSETLISQKGLSKMTNTTCYDYEGVRVCTPEDTQIFAKYAFVGLVALIGIASLIFLPADNTSVTGTEVLGETINYFAP
jgi:hypothetical protein